MSENYRKDKDPVRNFLLKHHPEHVNGYDNGWLLINRVYALGQIFFHIYSWNGEKWAIVGTCVSFNYH